MSISCTETDPEVQQAHDDLMELHDASMELMSPLKKAKKSLEKLENPTPEQKATLAMVVQADEDMWAWMHGWENPDDELSKEEKLDYYELWHQKMKLVDEDMKAAIAKSASYVK